MRREPLTPVKRKSLARGLVASDGIRVPVKGGAKVRKVEPLKPIHWYLKRPR